MGLLFSLLLDMILEDDGVQEEVESNKLANEQEYSAATNSYSLAIGNRYHMM
jgi:hypothetical protein